MSGDTVFIRGFLRSKRHHAAPSSLSSALTGRWGQRYVVVYADHFIDSKDEAQAQEVHSLDFRSVKDIRWATQAESKAGYGVLGEVVDTMRAMVGKAAEDHSVQPTTRFVIECEGDVDADSALIYEAESATEAMRWFVVLSERIHAISGAPVSPIILVKEDAGRDIREFYDLGEGSLGSGMSGVVKKIIRKSDGMAFAMKTVSLSQLSAKQVTALRNEIEILKIMDHPHICKLYETYTEPGLCVRLVIELCEGGELFDRLHARKRLSEAWVAKLVLRMAGCLRYLHENRIAHRDLKLENWLFRSKADDDQIVLIDFGLSHKYRPEEHMHKKVGTSYYVSPEVLAGDYKGVQADMWSLGVIVYMLLAGTAPFDGPDDEAILRAVASHKIPTMDQGVWKRISDSAKDFVRGLLTVDPDKRLSAEAALEHPWVKAEEQSLPSYDIDEQTYQNLKSFSQFPELKRLALEVIAFSLGHDEIKQLLSVFESLDSDHNGYITFAGLKRGINKLRPITDAECRRIFDALDEEHTGKIHAVEFVAAALQEKNFLTEANLRHAFHQMDHTNSGYITVHDLKMLLGKHVTEARATQMIREAELDDHGDSHKLSFQEFLWFVRKDGEREVDSFKVHANTPQSSQTRTLA